MNAEEWPELDTLAAELREQSHEGWQQVDELRSQFEPLNAQKDLIASQCVELRVRELLQSINTRILGGLGTLEIVQAGAGLELIHGLVWSPHIDPRRHADEAEGTVYRIDVWLGLSLEDAKARVRIIGAKRLEATLPTSPERFRSALLAVLREPRLLTENDATGASAHFADDESTDGPSGKESEATTGQVADKSPVDSKDGEPGTDRQAASPRSSDDVNPVGPTDEA